MLPVALPVVFVAVTLKPYAVPLVNPEIVHANGDVPACTVQVLPVAVKPLNASIVYEEVGPTTPVATFEVVVPLAETPVTVTATVVLPALADATDGAPGVATIHLA